MDAGPRLGGRGLRSPKTQENRCRPFNPFGLNQYATSGTICRRSRCERGMRNNSAGKAHLVVLICWHPHQRSTLSTDIPSVFASSRLTTYKRFQLSKKKIRKRTLGGKSEKLKLQRLFTRRHISRRWHRRALVPNGSVIIDSLSDTQFPAASSDSFIIVKKNVTQRGAKSSRVQHSTPNGATPELL